PKLRQGLGARVGDLSAEHVQSPQPGHVAEMLHPGVRNSYAVEVQVLHLRQITQVLEPVVGDERAQQVQPAKILHLGERRKRIVEYVSVAQVKGFQIDQGFEVLGIFDGGVVQSQVLQLGE